MYFALNYFSSTFQLNTLIFKFYTWYYHTSSIVSAGTTDLEFKCSSEFIFVFGLI